MVFINCKPVGSLMPVLALPLVLALAAAHAPSVAPETLLAFAQAESALDALAVHDNTTGRSHAPATAAEAVALATALLRQGHSVDLGLLQINDANLSRTGLTVATAFEPGANIRAGAQIMTAAYRQCQPGRDEPDALRCMASVYNTGREQAGLLNGYVARVWRAADVVVPAIRKAAEPATASAAPPPPDPCGPPPPSWDGWATAGYDRCQRRETARAAQPSPQATESKR
jgi:type IV secretion system protein VirB1